MKGYEINKYGVISLFLMFLFVPSSCWSWQGKVVGVSDGDTITVMHEGKGEKIRLYGADCPESHQDFGSRAKQFTSDKVFGKMVDIDPVDKDRYGRTVGIVGVDGQILNRALIEAGLAWLYEQYCKRPECAEWRQVQEKARTSKVGLWSVSNPVPPWEFRKAGRTGNDARKIEPGQKGFAPESTGGSGSGGTQQAMGEQSGSFHGNVESKVFHKSGCQAYDCKNCTAVFKTRDEALKAGYKPCGMCKP